MCERDRHRQTDAKKERDNLRHTETQRDGYMCRKEEQEK